MPLLELGLAYLGAGGSAKATPGYTPGSGVDWSQYGKKSEAEKADAAAFDKNGGYGVDPALMKRPGITKGAVSSYLDTSDSDAFRTRLDGQMASLAGRSAPTAGNTAIGPGAKFNRAALGPAATYGGASLNLGDDAAARAQQAKVAAMLAARADGTATAPGVQQLYASLAKNNAAATAAAGSARSPNAGLAMRALAGQKAAATQGAAGDAAILKAQDQQMAQTALANLNTSMRSADFAGAETNAALKQNASLFSADAMNKAAMARAAGDQQGSMFNAGVAQEQYGMDQQVALANMEAYLRNQGLNDAAIAARMGMYQDGINQDKQDSMGFWGYASGNRKFDSAMDYAREKEANMRSWQQLSAAGSAAGVAAGYFGSQKDDPPKYGGGDAAYDSDGKRKIVTTSDARQKTGVRDGSPVLRKWLDEMGGAR